MRWPRHRPDDPDAGPGQGSYQASLKRHRLLPNTPTMPELAVSEEGGQVLRAVVSTGDIGRSILITPDVPAIG